jgi:hypothetical protein
MTEPISAPPAPMPFRILIDEAMRHSRRHWRAILPAVAVPVALLAGATAALQASNFQGFFGTVAQGGTPSPFAMWSPGLIVLTLVYVFVLALAGTVVTFAVTDAVNGRPIAMPAVWASALRLRVLGTILLNGLAVLAAVFCCCLPVLYVAPLLSLTSVAMRAEGIYGPQAMSRSANLTQYNPTRNFFETALVKVFLVMVLGGILSWVVSAIVAFPFQAPMYANMMRQIFAGEPPNLDSMGTMMWLQVPAQVLSSLVSMALALYIAFCTVLLFFDTRNRKEGTDLKQAMDAVFAP